MDDMANSVVCRKKKGSSSDIQETQTKESHPEKITSEEIGYWYLRLNGFLSIPNFLIHWERIGNSQTEIDVLGVRFPYRKENRTKPMEDDSYFTSIKTPYLVITDIKDGFCCINEAWLNPNKENLEKNTSCSRCFWYNRLQPSQGTSYA